jgi:hypothetical protein
MPPSRSTRNTGRPARNSARELRARYLDADYLVGGNAAFVLKVDCASSGLLALHRRHGVDCSAFLTACNPRSERRSAAENQHAQRELEALLTQRGYACMPGRGVDPAGQWPDEPSVLALGLPAGEAAELARQFEQNAVLAMAADGVPRLVWQQQ